MKIERVIAPNKKDIDSIYQGLVDFNEAFVPNIRNENIALFVRGTDDEIQGGLVAIVLGEALRVEYFWLSEEIRGVGVGSSMINRLVEEVNNRELHGIYLDTYSFQAADFYQSHGFKEVGRYPDFPVKNVDKIFLCKRLDD